MQPYTVLNRVSMRNINLKLKQWEQVEEHG